MSIFNSGPLRDSPHSRTVIPDFLKTLTAPPAEIETSPHRARGGALYILVLFLVTVMAALIRLHHLDAVPFTFDEGATRYFAQLPLAELWGAPAALETNPPLYYTLEHWSVALYGDGVFALRLVSVVSGALCAPAAAFIARRFGGRPAGIAAALLVATSAPLVVSSQDARAYSTFTLAALLAFGAEIWLLDASRQRSLAVRGREGAACALYAFASIAALYLHNTAVLMLATFNLIALVCWFTVLGTERRFAIWWLGANLVVAAAYLFWLPTVAHQSVNDLADFWIPVPTLMDLRYAMMNVYALPYFQWLQPAPDALFLAAALMGAIAYRSNRSALWLAVFVVVGVPALTWLISQWRPLMNGKTLLWLIPFELVFVSLACARYRRLAVPLTMLLVVLQASGSYRYFETRWDEAFPEVASLLGERVRDGDAIYLDSPANEILLSYYGWPRDRLQVYAASDRDRWFRAFDGTMITRGGTDQMDPKPRIWVLTRAHDPEHHAIAERLGATMDEVLNLTFGHGLLRSMALRNLRLSLFEAKPS